MGFFKKVGFVYSTMNNKMTNRPLVLYSHCYRLYPLPAGEDYPDIKLRHVKYSAFYSARKSANNA